MVRDHEVFETIWKIGQPLWIFCYDLTKDSKNWKLGQLGAQRHYKAPKDTASQNDFQVFPLRVIKTGHQNTWKWIKGPSEDSLGWWGPSPISEGIRGSYADLLTTACVGASPQASQGCPPEVPSRVIQRRPQVPRDSPPQPPMQIPMRGNYGYQLVAEARRNSLEVSSDK